MFYRKYSYTTRIWITFMLLIILSILTTGWASYYIAANVLQENSLEMSQDTVNKSAQVVDEKLQKIAVSIMSLMMSDSFNDAMDDVAIDTQSRYYQHLSELQPVFSQLLFNESIIHSILIVTPIGDFYPTNMMRDTSHSFYDSYIYEEIRLNRRPIWQVGHKDKFFKGEDRVLSLVLEGGMNYPLNKVYIVVNIKEKELVHILEKELDIRVGPVFLLNSQGQFVMKPSNYNAVKQVQSSKLQNALTAFDPEGSMKDGYFELETKSSTELINFYRSELVSDWVFFRKQSKDQLLSQASAIKWMAITIMSVCALMAFVISHLLSRWLTFPLNKLVKLMSRVQSTDDLRTRYHSGYNDEVSKAGLAFNHMLDRIERLIFEIHEAEQSKRKAEMKALTAQIDPHFFYNALHTVYCKSVLGENENVNEMIIALSDMFRLGLNNGRDVTTLKAELDHVRQYLVIQQNCYEQLFMYDIHIDEAISTSLPVLKLILQPLVENSILHGFKDRSSGGEIQISATPAGEMLQLIVSDNGSGFDTSKIKIEKSLSGDHGYALGNIQDRLKLYYGGRADFNIESDPDEGTKVTIQIPYEWVEDANDE